MQPNPAPVLEHPASRTFARAVRRVESMIASVATDADAHRAIAAIDRAESKAWDAMGSAGCEARAATVATLRAAAIAAREAAAERRQAARAAEIRGLAADVREANRAQWWRQ